MGVAHTAWQRTETQASRYVDGAMQQVVSERLRPLRVGVAAETSRATCDAGSAISSQDCADLWKVYFELFPAIVVDDAGLPRMRSPT